MNCLNYIWINHAIDGRMYVDNVMLCTYRASDYFYFMLKLKGNECYMHFLVKKYDCKIIVDMLFVNHQDNTLTVIVECHGR